MREFIIPGEPKGKGRPRFSKNGRAWTPEDTVNYENLVKLIYKSACKEPMYEQGVPLWMSIYAFYSIPKSESRKKSRMMLEGLIRPTKKPDIDNMCKIIMDSLNKVAYHDDAQIVSAHIQKFYSDNPRVVVRVGTFTDTGVEKE